METIHMRFYGDIINECFHISLQEIMMVDRKLFEYKFSDVITRSYINDVAILTFE